MEREKEYDYYSPVGMGIELENWLQKFRKAEPDSVMSKIPLKLFDFNYRKRTMTVYLDPTPWMADRTGGMSNGAFSVALDETMGILCLYFMDHITPTITMQMSLLRPIPTDKRLFLSAKLLGTDGTKIDVSATAWTEGHKDDPVCTAVGIYYGPGKPLPKN